ncbi:LysR family transcriptional regulator [Rhodobacteraceae bacterium]|nr:LysR family transcriptional regulator [Paracoccaceae bacterium]
MRVSSPMQRSPLALRASLVGPVMSGSVPAPAPPRAGRAHETGLEGRLAPWDAKVIIQIIARGINLIYIIAAMNKLLEQFLAIVEAGSILKAAEVLNISQPALTHNLKKLEAQLGAVLVTRSARGVRMTDCGETLYQSAVLMRRVYSNALERVERQRAADEHGISIGTGYSVWLLFLRDLLFDHGEMHPNAPVNVSLGNAMRCMDQLLAGDTALFIGHEAETLLHKDAVRFFPLCMTHDTYFVHAGHPLLEGPQTLAAVLGHPTTIAFPPESRQKQLFGQDAGASAYLLFEHRHHFTSSILDDCIEFARRRRGVVIHNQILTPYFVAQGLRAVQMCAQDAPAPWPLGIYVLAERLGDATIVDLIAKIRAHAARLNLPPVTRPDLCRDDPGVEGQ